MTHEHFVIAHILQKPSEKKDAGEIREMF